MFSNYFTFTKKSMPTIYRNLFAMGTRLDMVFPGTDEDTGDYIYSLVSKEIIRLEEMLSNYNQSSALSQLNESSFMTPFFPDEELFSIINDLKRFHRDSLGFFDVSQSKFSGSSDKQLLTNQKSTLLSAGMSDIILNTDNKSVQFSARGLMIDSGGFGKGFALEKVKKLLSNHYIHDAFISFGESSVLCMGNHPYGDGWKISIPDIYSSENVYHFHLKDNSLSVSGNTPSNLSKYPMGHIINPFTGSYADKKGILCVTGPSAFVAEILSTALFIAGDKEQIQILKNFPDYEAVSISYSESSKVATVNQIALK
jgi:thiamine biosynthesis lipoprotein